MPKESSLPALPKQYKRKEAKVDSLVLDWFRENYPYSVAIEVKVGKNKALKHQEAALSQVQDGAFSFKIPDMGRLNPFDGFVLKGAHAYIVTCYGMTCDACRIDGNKKFSIKLKPPEGGNGCK